MKEECSRKFMIYVLFGKSSTLIIQTLLKEQRQFLLVHAGIYLIHSFVYLFSFTC